VFNESLRLWDELLPESWDVAVRKDVSGQTGEYDALLEFRDPDGVAGRLAVEVMHRVRPRDVDALLVARQRFQVSVGAPDLLVLVVAPWLSGRTRQLLIENGFGYLDLTGNAHLTLDRPGLVVRTAGADQDPQPVVRGSLALRGRQAGRVIRLLVDVSPPYTASALANVSGASVPYVSRLLTTLDAEALVSRGERGLVVDVDWQNLLRRRAEVYGVFTSNEARGYLAGTGAREAFRTLFEHPDAYMAVTGSFAAAQLAPVAVPAQLALYVGDPDATATALGLLPTDRSADVVLLRQEYGGVMEGARTVGGVGVVAPSQLALDCLTGNGRMPAEGEALLEWMATHEHDWRAPRLKMVGG
jgi:hypothetical protein